MKHTDIVTIDGEKYRLTYSDTYTLERDGDEYACALDPIDIEREYTETKNKLNHSVEELIHQYIG